MNWNRTVHTSGKQGAAYGKSGYDSELEKLTKEFLKKHDKPKKGKK